MKRLLFTLALGASLALGAPATGTAQNPAQPAPNQPAPVQPVPNQPVPNQPVPNQPVPNQPVPNQPVPNQPVPNQPAPNAAQQQQAQQAQGKQGQAQQLRGGPQMRNARPDANAAVPDFPVVAAKTYERPQMQLAILLDVSGSMSGLINQAKTELWKVVNELVSAKKDGKRPELRVALFVYGMSGNSENAYIQQLCPLTTDLDTVSEKLFELSTSGSSEYCGTVIKAATDSLAWSAAPGDLKTIFIAGNEEFTQGGMKYQDAIAAARKQGIVVNTIYCGSADEGARTGWKDGAVLGGGNYMSINHNKTALHVKAPQDEKIAKLGEELNKTYVPFGAAGLAGAARQKAQDSNASGAGGGAATQRALSKAGGFYRNSAWDLVDALKEGKVKLEDLKDDQLPAKLRKMTKDERKAYLDKLASERKRISEEIKKLNTERKKFVAAEMRRLALAEGADTLEAAMVKSIRKLAKARGLTFDAGE